MAKYLTEIKRGIISVYMFPASNVCSGGLSDIGSHPHFMTKGRGDSTNSLETHVNLFRQFNKQRHNSTNIVVFIVFLEECFVWEKCHQEQHSVMTRWDGGPCQ